MYITVISTNKYPGSNTSIYSHMKPEYRMKIFEQDELKWSHTSCFGSSDKRTCYHCCWRSQHKKLDFFILRLCWVCVDVKKNYLEKDIFYFEFNIYRIMNENLSASVLCLILVLVVKAEEFTDDQRDGHILSQG